MSIENDLRNLDMKEKELERTIDREEAAIKRLEPEVAREKRELERAEQNLAQHETALHQAESQKNIIAMDAKRRHEQFEREELKRKSEERRKAA